MIKIVLKYIELKLNRFSSGALVLWCSANEVHILYCRSPKQKLKFPMRARGPAILYILPKQLSSMYLNYGLLNNFRKIYEKGYIYNANCIILDY
jgi:hypothetical protein